ncbi:MAG: outer membrane beta-barrel protein [Chitinophagaceae bacterium]|nr:outer membrane beta-barrel protein [Chitinophagaceae bacterium]
MRRILFTALILGIIATANAQTEKGDWLVGGRVDINTGDNSTVIGFSPGAGLFVIDNLAIGANLNLNYTKSADIKVTNFAIGPFVRYYFTKAKVRPLLHGSINFGSTKVKTPLGTESNTASTLFLGGGVAIFINDNVSLEPIIGYSNTKYKNFEGSGAFNFGFGFQVYLNKGQVDKLRGK